MKATDFALLSLIAPSAEAYCELVDMISDLDLEFKAVTLAKA